MINADGVIKAGDLITPLILIINQSIITGNFPWKLEIAKILPLLKKKDNTIMDNYRPISLLTFIPKLFEKVVFSQLFLTYFNNKYFIL